MDIEYKIKEKSTVNNWLFEKKKKNNQESFQL